MENLYLNIILFVYTTLTAEKTKKTTLQNSLHGTVYDVAILNKSLKLVPGYSVFV